MGGEDGGTMGASAQLSTEAAEWHQHCSCRAVHTCWVALLGHGCAQLCRKLGHLLPRVGNGASREGLGFRHHSRCCLLQLRWLLNLQHAHGLQLRQQGVCLVSESRCHGRGLWAGVDGERGLGGPLPRGQQAAWAPAGCCCVRFTW